MTGRLRSALSPYWPGSLFARLALGLSAALLVAHLLGGALAYMEVFDFQVAKVSYYLAKDAALLIPALETTGAAERSAWLSKMQRKAYRFELGAATPTAPTSWMAADASLLGAKRSRQLLGELYSELGPGYPLVLAAGQAPDEDLRLRLFLKDGSPLTVTIFKVRFPLSAWEGALFFSQVLVMLVFIWLGVRQATRPLQRLVSAAERLGSSLQGEAIAEEGPTEVVRAAAAFNAMQRRITGHLAERVQLLAAISHDLQTPITRMRLRADLLDDVQLRDKLQRDLDAMQVLVEEGITYARSAQSLTEAVCRVDLDALLDSLVCDYIDAGQHVLLGGEAGQLLSTRPHTLRRIVVNLVDNALKFGGQAELQVTRPAPGALSIAVLDRGPGIAASELTAVLQPFYRVESSRNRSTGGTGLGLAIAQQLSLALDASLTLANRNGGGLEARITFKSVCVWP